MTLKPQSHTEMRTTNCNSENLVVMETPKIKTLFFLPPAPEKPKNLV